MDSRIIHMFFKSLNLAWFGLDRNNFFWRNKNDIHMICYLIQNKIVFDKDDFFNIKSIAQSNMQAIKNLVQKLIKYTVYKYGIASHHQTVNIMMPNDEK